MDLWKQVRNQQSDLTCRAPQDLSPRTLCRTHPRSPQDSLERERKEKAALQKSMEQEHMRTMLLMSARSFVCQSRSMG